MVGLPRRAFLGEAFDRAVQQIIFLDTPDVLVAERGSASQADRLSLRGELAKD